MGAKKLALILTAAGSSARFSSGLCGLSAGGLKKEYEALQSPLFPEQKGGTVLSCAADAFLSAFDGMPDFNFSHLIITLPPEREHRIKALNALRASAFTVRMLEKASLEPEFIEGGSDRRESVLRALEYLAGEKEPDIVLVHDAARPFVTPALIRRVLNLCAEKGAAAPAVLPVDTYKEAEQTDGRILRH